MKTQFFRLCFTLFHISLFAAVVTLIGMAGTAVSQAQSKAERAPSVKLGYVDSQVIIQQFPEAVEAQKKIQVSLQSWQEQIDTMAKAYQTRLEEYDKKKAMLNDQAKLAEEQKLLSEQQKIVDFRNKKLGQGGELSQLQEKTMTPVRQKILRAIEGVAAEEGMSFVFDKGAEVPVLLFGEGKFDVTFKVLDRLKRGK